MRAVNLLLSFVSLIALSALIATDVSAQQQSASARPCRDSQEYRQLDFWVGEWEVLGPKGKTVGASSVQLILGDCVVFENWTGAGGYTGKSFNLYDARTRKW